MPETESLFRVDGLVAVISGGGTGVFPSPELSQLAQSSPTIPPGIGLTMAKALAQNGAHKVYIIGRRLSKLQEAAASVSALQKIIPLQGDVTSKDSLARMAEQVKTETGHINLLVCNSGTEGPLIEDMPPNPSLAQIRDYMWA